VLTVLVMLARTATLVVAFALGASACSSSSPSGTHDVGTGSSGGGGDDTGDDGSTTTPGVDGGPPGTGTDGSSTATGDAPSGPVDGGSTKTGDGGAGAGSDAGGGAAAGASGVVTFCTQACTRATTCAAMVDGGSVNMATCVSNCTTMNEAGPPNGGDVVLYRADYVVDLTSCIASVDCADTLNDKAADDCQTSLASSFSPSAAVVTLCQKLEASTCSQDVTPDCLASFLPYSDATVQAITTCIEDPTCTNHDACVAQALTP
jgi:hypothetical protein